MTGFDDGEEENVINLMVRPGMKEGGLLEMPLQATEARTGMKLMECLTI